MTDAEKAARYKMALEAITVLTNSYNGASLSDAIKIAKEAIN